MMGNPSAVEIYSHMIGLPTNYKFYLGRKEASRLWKAEMSSWKRQEKRFRGEEIRFAKVWLVIPVLQANRSTKSEKVPSNTREKLR